MADLATDTRGKGVLRPEVRVSRAAIDALEDLPKRHTRAVAAAIDNLRSGKTGQRLKFSLPGAYSENYYAMRTGDGDAPVVIYRPLTEAEGGGYLVTAIVGHGDFGAYERADEKGILDTAIGRFVLDAAAATVQGNPVEARHLYQEAISTGNTDAAPRAMNNLGDLEREQGKLVEARHLFG